MTVVIVSALVELALLMLAVTAALRTWRRYQRHRVEVTEFWMALEDALASQIGATASRLVLGEAKIWVGLIVWLLQRRRTLKNDTYAYAAASQLGLITVVVLFLVALEGGVSGLLIPLLWLKILLFVVAAYAAIWIAGIYASLRAYPHLVTEHGLLVRYGVLAEGWIPWTDIEDISLRRGTSPGGADGLFIDGETATFAVGGKTTLTIRRWHGGHVAGFLRRREGITTVHLAADEPEQMAAAVRAAIAHHGGEESSSPPAGSSRCS